MEKEQFNIGKLLKFGYEALRSVGIDSYQIDCELLLGKVIKKDRLFILLNRDYKVTVNEEQEYCNFINLRKQKMPIKYILGECEFMGLDFYIKEGVLIPRPDTEVLVELAIKCIKEQKLKNACDVCCGSGAIGISIAKFVEDIKVKCSDISNIAYEVTLENIKRFELEHKVEVIKSDLLNYFINNKEKFDIIISNPPYIREDVIPTLMEDVKNYEPYEALSGGQDGLDFYRKITLQSLKLLNNNGFLLFEIGYDQKDSVSSILEQNGFTDISCIKDLAGKDRVIKGKREIS
ncbi:SAM-dependent methyltransferase [Clostridium carboxidivorans P7]|uniref:Release factor glutamine methyltransferase n=1 Tax=Clostridium carboxidivorans P7 TaxID=536227 RepID=C6PVE6_9CLOT|nr:peptide chain release factor N(5)-glutamine methyltransferase [Clostridium carboxidivorans]AKN33296.1 SAM-dependent methyltransferase [Clostridium carboxidivorans P7]EET86788.1 modification methylase, HemK family [Clostridium carboxidivorans P7]